MKLPTVDRLLTVGFRDLAKWAPTDEGAGIKYVLDSNDSAAGGSRAKASEVCLDVKNALYAFAEGDTVQYIGKTARSIRRRFAGYCTPSKTQRTNWRCHHKIKQLIGEGRTVRILVFTPISHLRYGEFEIDLAAGLEDTLIAAFEPPWNGRDGSRPITEQAEREEIEEAEPLQIGLEASITHPTSPAVMHPEQSRLIPSEQETHFELRLSPTYYDQGIINPGKRASQHLGQHGDRIIVYLGSISEQVDSAISRTANLNGSVRIVGNNQRIAVWFQKHFRPGDLVQATIRDAHHIMLLPP